MKKLLETARGTFNIRTYGSTDKPPLIMIHGWPQTSYCWHHAAPFLEDFYLIAPDLRGMGDSNRDLDVKLYEKDQLALDIFSIADHLGIDQFFLAGHDWGGAVVQEMVFLHPERIQKLVILNMIIINNPTGIAKASELLAPHFYRSSWYQHFLSIKEFPEAMIEGKEEIWVRFFNRGITNPVPEDAMQEYIRCYKIPHTLTTAANLYRTISKDRKRWRQFKEIKVEVPTHFIYGILDPVIVKEYLEGVENHYVNSQVTRLHGGHFILDEQPEIVGNAIKDFLLAE